MPKKAESSKSRRHLADLSGPSDVVRKKKPKVKGQKGEPVKADPSSGRKGKKASRAAHAKSRGRRR